MTLRNDTQSIDRTHREDMLKNKLKLLLPDDFDGEDDEVLGEKEQLTVVEDQRELKRSAEGWESGDGSVGKDHGVKKRKRQASGKDYSLPRKTRTRKEWR